MPTPYSELSTGVNQFMQGQAQQAYVNNLPDYQNMRTQQSSNIGSQLRGEVPQDVVNQILQQAAERGIMTGNNNFLQSLGLTSIGQQQQGTENLNTAINQTPVAELWNPMSLYVPQTLGREERASYEASRAAEEARALARQQQQFGGGHPGLGFPSSVDLSGAGRRQPQFGSPPSWQSGGGFGSGFNSPVIGGSSNIGGASFFGGQQQPTSDTYNSWNQWNQSLPQFAPGGGNAWLGGGAQGPTQQPSMTDAQWEDTFWY